MRKKNLNLSRLEKLPETELLKLNNEYNEIIKDNNKFLDNFDIHFENFKSCYLQLEQKVKEINIFFKSNFRVNQTETGIFSKSIERHLVFDQKTKIEYEKKLEEIIKIYVHLLKYNDIFPSISFYPEKINYLSDNIFNCNRHKRNNNLHLFNFEIETLEKDSGKPSGYGVDIFNFEALNGYKSLSFQLNIPKNYSFFTQSSRNFPKAIAEKLIYEKVFADQNSDYEKILRKIELILRARKKGKEKIENIGYVYVLSNEAYKNIYKIGSTYGLPEERAEELTGTGHLSPFKVESHIKIQSAEYYEKNIHNLLKDYRVKQNREFFEIDLNKIKNCLKQVSEISEKGSKKITLIELKKEINL